MLIAVTLEIQQGTKCHTTSKYYIKKVKVEDELVEA